MRNIRVGPRAQELGIFFREINGALWSMELKIEWTEKECEKKNDILSIDLLVGDVAEGAIAIHQPPLCNEQRKCSIFVQPGDSFVPAP